MARGLGRLLPIHKDDVAVQIHHRRQVNNMAIVQRHAAILSHFQAEYKENVAVHTGWRSNCHVAMKQAV
jgi:hypothetical protein